VTDGASKAPQRSEGEIAADVSNAVVRLFTDFYGRGPVKAKTYLVDDYVFTVLEETLTVAERTLVRAGREELVRTFRLTFQTEMYETFVGAVERAVGRRVLTHHSQIAFNPEVCIEFFRLGDVDAATGGG
jgi:uncharacterized protein YbcI